MGLGFLYNTVDISVYIKKFLISKWFSFETLERKMAFIERWLVYLFGVLMQQGQRKKLGGAHLHQGLP